MSLKQLSLWCGMLLAASCAWTDARDSKGTPITEFAAVVDAANAIEAESKLIVFDIDNTLLTADELIGSERWVEWFLGNSAQLGHCPFDIINIAYEIGSMSLTDPQVVAIYQALSRHDILLLTARADQQRSVTIRELRKNGLHFSINPPLEGRWNESISSSKRTRNVVYDNGLMMVAGGDKGEALKAFLTTVGKNYQAIIFVDDKKENLLDISKAMTSTTYTLELLHYQGQRSWTEPLSDAEITQAKNFNEITAQLLQSYFPARYQQMTGKNCLY